MMDAFYKLVAFNQRSDALDLLYSSVDRMLRAGHFSAVDLILKDVDLERLDIAMLLGFLTITLAAKDILLERAALYDRIEAKILQLAPDRIEGLLQGLR